MTRKPIIRQDQFPYHVTIRTNHKSWFQIPLIEVWNLSKEAFRFALEKNPVKIHCFVLMSNHYHLLVSTPNSDLDKFMRNFNSRLSFLIGKKSREMNRDFSVNKRFNSPYGWTIVDNENYLETLYRYIYQNPVRANLTKNAFNYPYSSLHFSSYESILFNYKPHFEFASQKSSLEKRFDPEVEKIIRQNLCKEKFTPSQKISARSRDLLNSKSK